MSNPKGNEKIRSVAQKHKNKKMPEAIGMARKFLEDPAKHIGVAIAEGKRTKGYGVEGEKTYSENNSLRDPNSHEVDFSEFTNEDGHLKGGIDVEMTGPQDTAEEKVRSQRRMLPEKRKTAKWF